MLYQVQSKINVSQILQRFTLKPFKSFILWIERIFIPSANKLDFDFNCWVFDPKSFSEHIYIFYVIIWDYPYYI